MRFCRKTAGDSPSAHASMTPQAGTLRVDTHTNQTFTSAYRFLPIMPYAVAYAAAYPSI